MDKIKAHLVIELMGRPPEHIKEALNTLVVKMGSEKGISLIDKKYHKPKAVKEAKNLHITFAEVEAEFEDLNSFFGVIFNYMPSNIEVYSPEKFKLNNYDLNTLSNFVLSKMHNYDSIAKNLVAERNILLNQIEVLRNKGIKMDVLDEFRKKAEKNLKITQEDKNKKKPRKKKTKKK